MNPKETTDARPASGMVDFPLGDDMNYAINPDEALRQKMRKDEVLI